MEEVKRYDLTAPEKGMPMLYPSDKGVCVLYTDYAALKARVEELERGKNAMLWADLTVKLREATQERDSLRAEVMEQARLLGMSGSREADLCAQLEAANGRAEVAENNFKQAAALLQSYQDDADQPKNNLIENVKGAIVEAREWIDHKNTCPCWNSNLGWKWCDCGFERLNDFLGEAIDKLHAAPAPAPLDKSEGPSTELVYKAAPAPVCKTCGGSGIDPMEDRWQKPCPDCSAPKCKTCGDSKVLLDEDWQRTKFTPLPNPPVPCPDCAKEVKL